MNDSPPQKTLVNEARSESELAEQQEISSANNVLIVDGDEHFLELATHLLQSHGYDVCTAKNAHEAFCQVSAKDPGLIVVDYRLPGMDGITWIGKLRKAGKQMPVILCTGAWLDQHTFTWLRNMLKVCLVVQKPIVPELFVQSIESVLPPTFASLDETVNGFLPATPCEDSDWLETYERIVNGTEQQTVEELDGLIATTTDPSLLQELKQLRRKMATQQAINQARKSFIDQLPRIWDELLSTLNDAHADLLNQDKLNQAKLIAHKIKGASGSYDLHRLSRNAERIEELLQSIDPTCETERDLIWSEVMRFASEGTNLTHPEEEAPAVLSTAPPLTLLVVGCTEEPLTNLITLSAHDAGFVPQFACSAPGALNRGRSEKFDAALIDLNIEPPTATFELERSLRAAPANQNLPFCFISRPETPVTVGALLYAGATAVVKTPPSGQVLTLALKSLHRACTSQRSRILRVDDDELLTQFIESVLSSSGYVVRSLHEPTAIIEAVQEFNPELILMDILMPGLSGYDACRMLKSKEQGASIPVVFLTAKADARSRAGAFQAGGVDFLSKPVLANELLMRVQGHLAIGHANTCDPQNSGRLLPPSSFKDRAARVLKDCSDTKSPCTLAIISIADSGEVQGEHGSFVFEQVASSLAQLLSVRFRLGDLCSRLAADRFGLLLPDADLQVMDEVCEALRQDYSSIWHADSIGRSFQISLKFASAGMGIHADSIEDLLSHCVGQLGNALVSVA